jgi:Fe-S-cluster-containing hydrogenase component 2
MMNSLYIDASKCTGCLQCEMACSYENYGVFAPAKSRIKVFDFHETGRKVPYTCTQCDEAWCMRACSRRRYHVGRGYWCEDSERSNLRRMQGVHDRVPIRHNQLRAGDRQGTEV